jgi:hypothetical protein
MTTSLPARQPTRSLVWRFDVASLAVAVALFIALVWLATAGARLGWVRSFLGDVLAVIWVYACLKTVIASRAVWLAAAALAMGLLIELGQYIAAVFQLQIPNRALRVVLGSTPDWWDVLAYVLGFLVVLAVERWRARGRAAISPARAR